MIDIAVELSSYVPQTSYAVSNRCQFVKPPRIFNKRSGSLRASADGVARAVGDAVLRHILVASATFSRSPPASDSLNSDRHANRNDNAGESHDNTPRPNWI